MIFPIWVHWIGFVGLLVWTIFCLLQLPAPANPFPNPNHKYHQKGRQACEAHAQAIAEAGGIVRYRNKYLRLACVGLVGVLATAFLLAKQHGLI